MYQYILSAHIVVGIMSLLITPLALFLASSKNSIKYIYLLAVAISLEVLSGTYLAVASLDISALSLCKNLTIYSLFMVSTLAVLYMRTSKPNLQQYSATLGTVGSSYLVFLVVLTMGY